MADHDSNLKWLGDKLRRLREEQGISQRAMAAQMGIDNSTQYRRENGLTTWPVEDLFAYARVLNMHPGRILEEESDVAEH